MFNLASSLLCHISKIITRMFIALSASSWGEEKELIQVKNSYNYCGIGLRAGGFMELKKAKFGYIAPGVMFGKEYLKSDKSQRFIQVALGMGGLTTEGYMRFSSISLTFGYSF